MTTNTKTHTGSEPGHTPDGPLFLEENNAPVLVSITRALTPLEAAQAIERCIADVQRRTQPEKGASRPPQLENATRAAAEAAMALEAQQARTDAARNERYAADARLRAAKLEAEEPGAAYARRMALAAQRERERVEENMSREGRFLVDVDVDDAANGHVFISPAQLIARGWHHQEVCQAVAPGAAMPGNPLRPDHELIRQTWQAVYDWHDEEHGNGLWHGCAIQPCAGVPEAFRKEPWHHVDQDGY